MYYALIVDDEPLIRASVTKKIEESGHPVTVAGDACNGAEALTWLEKYYTDICVTDVRMPVMDGLELIRNINRNYPWIVSVIISSYDDFEYARQGIQLGVVDYILKPIDEKLLNEAMGKACERVLSSRIDRAHDILLKKGSLLRRTLQKWVELIKSGKNESDIIKETMEVLKSCAEKESYLLEAFSLAWLRMVDAELNKEGIAVDRGKIDGIKLNQRTIAREDMELYFEASARKILEAGIMEMYDLMKNVHEKKSSRCVEIMKAYIRENYARAVSLQELADKVEMSRTYISNLFKNETGMTLWNYLLSVRMEKAAELLRTTNMKVYEVGLSVGYENNVHFTQMFKEYYGVSPAEYKKREYSNS